MLYLVLWQWALLAAGLVSACSDDDWFSPVDETYLGHHAHLLAKRMQPDALAPPLTTPDPLIWGQINFIATTDTRTSSACFHRKVN